MFHISELVKKTNEVFIAKKIQDDDSPFSCWFLFIKSTDGGAKIVLLL